MAIFCVYQFDSESHAIDVSGLSKKQIQGKLPTAHTGWYGIAADTPGEAITKAIIEKAIIEKAILKEDPALSELESEYLNVEAQVREFVDFDDCISISRR